ncbi:X8 domain [Arabidopsis thaliana x Arabidopsis arenosa]|uniref:X8 domain n=1 Tax=Arabidopsis thaliana x Arabidopsis arenosa TaxID=1240361 RepID=A0A8T1YC71_9BRAS|nr:X8 domain [Arabidopsis thaliana x Arabidopsis arenosa]
MRVNAQAPGQGSWCVVKPGTPIQQLLKNINYVCSKINCDILSNGSSCYSSLNLYNLASVSMNLYYQSQGRQFSTCDFGGSGLISVTDPSCGCCKYEFHK